jgi:hypothetical protein
LQLFKAGHVLSVNLMKMVAKLSTVAVESPASDGDLALKGVGRE